MEAYICCLYTASQEYYVVYFYILRFFHFVYINIEKSLKQLLTLIFRVLILLPTATNKGHIIMLTIQSSICNMHFKLMLGNTQIACYATKQEAQEALNSFFPTEG